MPVQFLTFPTGAALFDPDKVSPGALTALISRGLTASSTPMDGCAGREGVRLIAERSNAWVWRHNRRGGWCGRIIRDSYVWLGAARTRAFREWRLLHHLQVLGLPAPAPVAAVYERRGLVYRSDLITGLLPGTESLGAKLRQGPLELSLWRAVGTCIRCFHTHGIYHADLNVHNILIGSDDQVYLIDFDRGAIRTPGSWIDANWARLRRSITKVCRELPAERFGETEWTALRQG
jgi:3-deoxy-D-manno-octulosonic acid kinase